MFNDGEFYAFLTGLVIGLICAMILVIIVPARMEDRFERECLLDQEVVLNGTQFTCERIL